jgi:hypothetical protein
MEGMVFKNNALVTAVSWYDFTNDRKEAVSGMSLEFIMTEILNPIVGEDGRTKGYNSMKDSMEYGMKDNFVSVPGMYELSFKMIPTKNNKPQLKVVGAKFIGEVVLSVKDTDKKS